MSTEHTLLSVDFEDFANPSSVNVDIVVLENSDVYSLDLFRTHSTLTDAYDHKTLVSGLTSAQLEQLAVRLLHIASYASDDPSDLLERYNIAYSDNAATELKLPSNVPLRVTVKAE